jgi:dual oxidase
LAERVKLQYPDWSDEDVFQRSRRFVIATFQNIIMYEYLPVLLGDDDPIQPYSGYKPDVHPGVSHVFQSAAFRFGHTMIPPGLYRRDAQCRFKKTPSGFHGLRLCSTWWDAQDVISRDGVEELLMGLTSQIAENEDSVLCSDVRGEFISKLFKTLFLSLFAFCIRRLFESLFFLLLASSISWVRPTSSPTLMHNLT